MFKLFSKKKTNVNKNKSILETVVDNVKQFEKENDYDKFTQKTITEIENEIIHQSKLGVYKIIYYNRKFHIHTDMNKVKEYFTDQGFNIVEWSTFVPSYTTTSEMEIWLDAEISWWVNKL